MTDQQCALEGCGFPVVGSYEIGLCNKHVAIAAHLYETRAAAAHARETRRLDREDRNVKVTATAPKSEPSPMTSDSGTGDRRR